MEFLDFLILIVAGALIGTVSSMIGVGGGILMVPLLSFFYVGTTQEAVGTSLAAVVVTSMSSSLQYARKQMINYPLALLLVPTVVAGAWLGAWLTAFISSGGLALWFGLLLLYAAGQMLLGRKPQAEAASPRAGERSAPRHGLRSTAIGLISGMASGFFGVGSGILMVPAMVLLLEVEMLEAVATSLLVMMPSSMLGSVQHWFLGHLHVELMIPLALGIIVGTQAGSRIAMNVSRLRLRQAFGAVLIYAGLNMIWKGIASWGG